MFESMIEIWNWKKYEIKKKSQLNLVQKFPELNGDNLVHVSSLITSDMHSAL